MSKLFTVSEYKPVRDIIAENAGEIARRYKAAKGVTEVYRIEEVMAWFMSVFYDDISAEELRTVDIPGALATVVRG